jgi:hypothetical protein
MSAVVMVPETGAASRAAQPGGVPFGRLLLTEWRKQIDTRAGRWLLIAIGIVAAVILTLQAVWGRDYRSFEDLLGSVSNPFGLLLPVVGILAATAEWSQRTGLVTFVLEPRRLRVGAAKLVAALLTGALALVVVAALAALAHLAVQAGGVPADWSLSGALAGGVVLALILSMVQGVAFGLVFQNTPAAIVVFFVLPTAFGIVGGLVTAVQDVWPWIDLSSAMMPLYIGDALTGAVWAHLATSTAIWVVAPLIGGLVRLSRSEIKSS